MQSKHNLTDGIMYTQYNLGQFKPDWARGGLIPIIGRARLSQVTTTKIFKLKPSKHTRKGKKKKEIR